MVVLHMYQCEEISLKSFAKLLRVRGEPYLLSVGLIDLMSTDQVHSLDNHYS